MQRRMLSKEDEAAVGEQETEVRREDQDKINKFSRLHQRETVLQEELKNRIKEKEELQEAHDDLEMASLESEDDEAKVPYKIGDCFVSLPTSEVLELLQTSQENIDKDVSALEEQLEAIKEEMQQLKISLYARFGRSINLET